MAVLVLMPGLGFSAPQYQAIAAAMASRGYVVAGVTPTYSANLTVIAGHPVKASAAGDPSDLDGLLKNEYRGCRYAFGYPACPDLEDRAKVVDLLGPDRIGVSLSEEFQLHPEQSTSAIVVLNPNAKYFSV